MWDMVCWPELTVSWGIRAMVGIALCAMLISHWLTSRRRWALLAHLPGPKPLPLIGNLLEFFDVKTWARKRIDMALMSMAEKCDGLFVVYLGSKPMVIITDSEYSKIFFTSSTMLDRSDSYKFVADVTGDTVFVAGGERWKAQRKMATINYFNSTSASVEFLLQNSLNVSKSTSAELTKTKLADGPVFKMFHLLQMAAFSTTMPNTLGKNVNHDTQLDLLKAMNIVMKIVDRRNINPLLSSNLIFSLTSQGRQYRRSKQRAFELVGEEFHKIAVQFKDLVIRGEPIPDLYGYNTLKTSGGEVREYIICEFMMLSVASLETTAATVGFALTMLALFPGVQEKVYQEDQEVQRRLQGRELEFGDMEHYAYLERVIKETLRLFPVGAVLGRKATEDTYFGNYLIPKGTDVINLQTYTFRNPNFFPEPLSFNPDRFLPENLDKIPPYAFTPFSAGPRICPGMRSAYIAMKVYVSSIVREFRVISQYTSLAEALRNTSASITLKDQNDFPIRLETRAK